MHNDLLSMVARRTGRVAWLAFLLASVSVLTGCGGSGATPDAGPPLDGAVIDDGGVRDISSEDIGGNPDASLDSGADVDGGTPSPARLVVLGPDGELASLDVADPWAVRASATLGTAASSVKCRALRCVVVHPSPGDSVSVIDTFSGRQVDDLALDRVEDLLFFPDPCSVTPSNQACLRGVHVFDAHSGARASQDPVDVGFTAIDLAVAR